MRSGCLLDSNRRTSAAPETHHHLGRLRRHTTIEMPLTSDLQLDYDKFRPGAVSQQTKDFNDALMEMMNGGPKWHEVGAEKYRQMRWNGEANMPRPQVLENGINIRLPSREAGREIPCRVFKPNSGKAKGVFYHIHGGGWVLQSEAYQDVMLDWIAQNCNLTVVSVGYRLAPEHPYPAGNEDCFDIGEWLIDHAAKEYGAPLLFVGGDSAGAHLSVVTCFHLLKSRPEFAFKGLVLNFGAFDLSSFLPHCRQFDMPLVLDLDIMRQFISSP